MADECKATWWRACKFQPRFDYVGRAPSPGMDISGNDVAGMLRAMGSETYICDVCERCGKRIERETTDAKG